MKMKIGEEKDEEMKEVIEKVNKVSGNMKEE